MNTESRSKKELPNPAKNEEAQNIIQEVKSLPMPIISFEVRGEPVAKARPRVTRFGVHTPQKTINYENWVKECFLISYGNDFVPLEGQLKAKIIAYFSIPKSKSNKMKIKMAKGEIRPIKKTDGDNIIKSITDALNLIAYKDDSQLVDISISKYYSEVPRVEISIQEAL